MCGFAQASGRDLAGFADGSFDLVLAVDSLPYVFRAGGEALLAAMLAEIARALRPGGELLALNLTYRGDPARRPGASSTPMPAASASRSWATVRRRCGAGTGWSSACAGRRADRPAPQPETAASWASRADCRAGRWSAASTV